MKSMEDALGALINLKRAIDAGPFDAVIASSPENVRYVGDVGVWTQTVIRERPVFIVWPKGRDPVYIVGTMEVARIREETWIRDIRTCEQTAASALDELVVALRDLHLDRGRIAIERGYMPARWVDHLCTALPHLVIEEAETIFASARMRKSVAEREHLARAYKSTGDAFLATFRDIRVGETEREAATRLTTNLLRAGADAPAFTFLCGGTNSLLPHPAPSGHAFGRDEMITSDSGGMFNDYFTNLGRTAKLGPLTSEDRSYWGKLRDIQQRIADMLRPGNTGRQLYQRACELHLRAGLAPPNTHNGHGIGLRIHERPMISAHEDTPYEPGMMSTVETRCFLPGRHAYHMEDLYEVTAGPPILHVGQFSSEEVLVVA